MSNENEYHASPNRLDNLIGRRSGSLREEVAKLKSQLKIVLDMVVEKDENLCDLSNRVRALETANSTVHSNNHKATSTHDLDPSDVGANVSVQSANNLGGNELDTEEHVNDLDTNVPSTSNEDNLNESTSANGQVNGDTPNLSPVSTTIDTEHEHQSTNKTSMQKSNETTSNANKMELFQVDEDEYQQIDVPEGGEEFNDNENEYLQEKSVGINQSFDNASQIDQQVTNDNQNKSFSTINEDINESSTSKQSKSRKRKRANKSLATEFSSAENSSTNDEMSISGPTARSKRVRVSASLNLEESAKQASHGLGVDSSDEEDKNGGDSSGEGEEGVETEMVEEDQVGHYKIKILKLKCTEDDCNDEVADTDKLHDHLRVIHRIFPYRCLAEGCKERFEQWTELGPHVKENHWNNWSCPYCTNTYKSQKALYIHLYFHHFEGDFKCGYEGCGDNRVAKFRIEIKRHQELDHPKESIYTCDHCGKSFNLKGNLRRHLRIH